MKSKKQIKNILNWREGKQRGSERERGLRRGVEEGGVIKEREEGVVVGAVEAEGRGVSRKTRERERLFLFSNFGM